MKPSRRRKTSKLSMKVSALHMAWCCGACNIALAVTFKQVHGATFKCGISAARKQKLFYVACFTSHQPAPNVKSALTLAQSRTAMEEIMQQGSLKIRGLSKSNVWDYENAFYWFSHPTRLNKMLAHYDLYKSIINLPGDVFELGVYKGASLIRLATFRNLLENDFSRKIVGFDAFGKFPTTNLTLKVDLDFIDDFEKAGGDGLALNEIEKILTDKNFQNVLLNEGNVFESLPKYLEKYPATRIAFLHLDMDVKEPTTFALELLYELVVPGGMIVLDDYNTVAGETDAVDEFLTKRHLKIEKTSHYHVPSFIRKLN